VLVTLLSHPQGAVAHLPGQLWRQIAGTLFGAGVTVAPFGAASAFIFWARYIARESWAGRHMAATWLLAIITAAGLFGAVVRSRARAFDARVQGYAANQQRLASPDRAISLRLVRVADADADVVKLVSYTRPSCALVLRSKLMADHVPVGSDVWVDITEPGPQSAETTMRVMKIGDVTDPEVLSRTEIWSCRPW
jgi:hypothetical protein